MEDIEITTLKAIEDKDDRPPLGLWAPGFYINKCSECDQLFTGDKRAKWCADCAYFKSEED